MSAAASTTVPTAATDPGLRLAVGVSRSGKTYGLRRQVYAAAQGGVPVIVLDRLREWRSMPAGVPGVRCRTVAQAISALRGTARLAVVETDNVERDALEACRWARDSPDLRGVASSEAHRWLGAETRSLDTVYEDCVLAWAHHRVSLWLDTQRLSLLNRSATEQMAELRVHAVGGQRDLEVLRELGGRELADAARECARRLVDGQPGWHVLIRTVALPPYQLRREGA